MQLYQRSRDDISARPSCVVEARAQVRAPWARPPPGIQALPTKRLISVQHRPRMAADDGRRSHGDGQALSTGHREIRQSEIQRDLPSRGAQNLPITGARQG